MKTIVGIGNILAMSILIITQTPADSNSYPWLDEFDPRQNIVNRISVPDGYARVDTDEGSFEDWLRHLPLKEGRPPVNLFNGKEKWNQKAHYAVIEMDVGSSDLQQCADAVIRLRAEYLYSIGRTDDIQFNFTSGHRAELKMWNEGYRPIVNGSNVKWVQSAKKSTSYENFKRYLRIVFTYAGTYSLSQELLRVQAIESMKIGDVFIQGGFPGHAVIVVDMAVNKNTGEKLFLLAQSFMPAQEMHILKNPKNSNLNPWYPLEFGTELYTPEWIFNNTDLRRFR